MTEELTLWQKWEAFIEALQADPALAIKNLVTENLAIVVPIALGVVGLIVITFIRG